MSGSVLQITTIDVPGGTGATVTGVSPGGEIVGVINVPTLNAVQGFVFNAGTGTLLSVPGALETAPSAVNAAGVIVGTFVGGGVGHGFVDDAGAFTTLDYAGAQSTGVAALNDSGVAVGVFDNSDQTGGAFVWNDGTFAPIPLGSNTITVLGATNVAATAINDAGQVVGYADGSGFVDTAGTVTWINIPGATATFATGINASGTIVGYCTDAAGNGYGFLDAGGVISTFDVPGAVSVGVRPGFEPGDPLQTLGITDSGLIYGEFTDAGGTTEGFFGTPGAFANVSVPGVTGTDISGIDAAGDLALTVWNGTQFGSALLATAVQWAGSSGSFGTAADWTPRVVPSAINEAIIAASGTYTVTASTNETMSSLAVAAGATLVVSAGTFAVSHGSGTGGLAGGIRVHAGAVLVLAGAVDVSGTLTIAGQLGGAIDGLANAGTVNADGTAVVTLDLVDGSVVNNTTNGLIETTGPGGLVVAGGTVINAGTLLAAQGSTLRFGPRAVSQNNSGVLRGNVWEAAGGTLAVTGGAVAHDAADIVLSGTGSAFSAGDGSTFTGLETSLTGVNPVGTLALLGGRSFIVGHGLADFGVITLGGGALTTTRLAVASNGHVNGSGTIVDTRYAVFNGGTIEASGGTLHVASAVDAKSSGVFVLDAASVLEIAADQGAGDKMNFLGAGGELVIDAVKKFGLNVGSASYAGPLIENFASGDAILLKDLAPTGLTPVYDVTTGLLQISNGSANVASLMFVTATLGSGSFHIRNGGGHALLTLA